MLVPLKWIENYIKIEHTPKEFGEILTKLEFMQDGPIKEINDQQIIDLEVRQNRPDMLSVIGVAREYAAYINKNIKIPKQLEELPIEKTPTGKMLSIQAKNVVKRFFAVEVADIKVAKSPSWLIDAIEAYGIPSVNNIVDITNYVMLEYGIPMHAFDLDKLPDVIDEATLTLRMAKNGEKLITWQEDEITLTSEDLIVADAENRIVSIGGITGEKESGISNSTTNIILEAANYDHAAIRRTALKHNLITDSALRHSKFLPSEVVNTAIKRALYLINELAGGEIKSAEDFYEQKDEIKTTEFNVLEVNRLGGVQLETDEIIRLLNRLGIEVVEQKEALGIDKNILTVKPPAWRTDLNFDVDYVEEVLRLWGYDNIPTIEIDSAPPGNTTPQSLILEEKVRDILIGLELDEHITNPLVTFSEENENQIKLENPLNQIQNALRISIRDTLKISIDTAIKAGQDKIGVFEVGKIYIQKKIGEYVEPKQIATLYSGYDFVDKIKPDFMEVLFKLGIAKKANWHLNTNNNVLMYEVDGIEIAHLYHNGYTLMTDNLIKVVEIASVPFTEIETNITQRIVEELSFLVGKKDNMGDISKTIHKSSGYIKSVELKDLYDNLENRKDKKSATFKVTFEDIEKKLTREEIEKVKNSFIKEIRSKLRIMMR